MSKDYYNILGVNKNASQDDIKKAFRKLAHEHHPDKKGGDEAKFKELNEAYQVLGDINKRAKYDQFGSAFEHGQAGGGFGGFEGFSEGFNVNMDDLGDMFGGIGDIFGFSARGGQGRRGARAKRGSDIEVSMTIDFMEAVSGMEKEIGLNKTTKCDKCKGEGAEPDAKVESCKVCGGRGKTTRVQRTIFGQMQVEMECSDCVGEGKSYSEKCSKCSGRGIVKEVVKLKIKIPAGIDDGGVIRLTGQGEVGSKGAPVGDLYLYIRVKKDSRFERQGNDVLTKNFVNFTQAVLGDKIEVETVDGPVTMKIPEGTESGTVFRLRGHGIPNVQGRGKGDHLVEVKIKTPKNLNKRQKEILKELGL
jgi:molecular chaperone DnaJ